MSIKTHALMIGSAAIFASLFALAFYLIGVFIFWSWWPQDTFYTDATVNLVTGILRALWCVGFLAGIIGVYTMDEKEAGNADKTPS